MDLLRTPQLKRRRAGFVLFEAMLAVAIFAIGILALGRCVENCLKGNIATADLARARRFLENEMALIEAGAQRPGSKKPPADKSTEELEGAFEGMTLKTTRVLLKEKNEKGQEINGIYEVNLDLSWKNESGTVSRQLTFLIYPRLK